METSPRARGRAAALALLATSAAAAGLVFTVHRVSPRSLLSAHGLLHSAIVQRLLASSAVPPENPFFAGEPLGYYWFFHFLGALVVRASGLDPLHALEALTLASAALLALAAGLLCRRVYASPWPGCLVAYLVLFGANPQGPLLLALRYLRAGAVVLEDDPTYLWGILHPLSRQLRLWDPNGMYGPLLHFYLNITARPLALTSLVGMLAALAAVLARPRAASLLALALMAAWTSACSVLTAGSSIGTLSAVLALSALAPETPLAERLLPRVAPRHAVLATAAMLLGLLLGGATYHHLFDGGATGTRLAPGGATGVAKKLVTMLAASWLTLLLAAAGAFAERARSGCELAVCHARLMVLAALGLFAATALLSLPVSNEDNFYHAALVMLATAAPSVLSLATGAWRRRAGLFIAGAFAPMLAALLFCYTGRTPLPLGFAHGALTREPPDARARLYSFIRGHTASDAVFVVDTRTPHSAMAGNSAELPALTSRTLFTERESHYIVRAHRALPARLRIADKLRHGHELSATERGHLATLDRPLYVVIEDPRDAARDAARERLCGPPVYEEETIRLYRYRQAPRGGS